MHVLLAMVVSISRRAHLPVNVSLSSPQFAMLSVIPVLVHLTLLVHLASQALTSLRLNASHVTPSVPPVQQD